MPDNLLKKLRFPHCALLVRPVVENRNQGRAVAASDVFVDCHRLRGVKLSEVPAHAGMAAQVPEKSEVKPLRRGVSVNLAEHDETAGVDFIREREAGLLETHVQGHPVCLKVGDIAVAAEGISYNGPPGIDTEAHQDQGDPADNPKNNLLDLRHWLDPGRLFGQGVA